MIHWVLLAMLSHGGRDCPAAGGLFRHAGPVRCGRSKDHQRRGGRRIFRPDPSMRNGQRAGAGTMNVPRFRNVAEALFWATDIPPSTDSGAKNTRGDPATVLDVIAALSDAGRLSADMVEVMTAWGVRGTPPNPARYALRDDWRLWKAGLDILEPALRREGIVV